MPQTPTHTTHVKKRKGKVGKAKLKKGKNRQADRSNDRRESRCRWLGGSICVDRPLRLACSLPPDDREEDGILKHHGRGAY